MVNFLSNFNLEGSNEWELRDNLKFLSNRTFIKKIEPYQLNICSIVSRGKNNIKFHRMEPDVVDYANPCEEDFISLQDLKELGVSDEILDSILEEGFFMEYDNYFMIPSKNMANALSKACGYGKVSAEPDALRDAYLSTLLRDAERNFNVIFRTNGTSLKIVEFCTENHRYVSQVEKFTTANDLIKSSCDSCVISYYKITQEKTVIVYDMSKKIKYGNKKYVFIPTITVTLSDGTDVKSSISGGISINGRVSRLGESISLYLEPSEIEHRVKELIKRLDEISEKIENLGDEKKDRKKEILHLCEEAELPSVGQKVFQNYLEYLEQFQNYELTEADVFAEILKFPSILPYAAKKNLPSYVIEKAEKLVGAYMLS